MRYHSGVDTSYQHEILTAKSARFFREFDQYLAVYKKLETGRRMDLTVRLLDIGKQVKYGTRTWVRHDLDDIASWKGLRPPMLMVETNSMDFNNHLERAIRMEDEAARIESLCDIRGMGPVLASMVLMFTWPETCGFMDYHTCNALRQLGFDFPRKHCTSKFTVPQLLSYLRMIRTLRENRVERAMEIAKALYALDSMGTKNEA